MPQSNAVLVDTNVVSYRFGNRPEFADFKQYLVGKIPAISFVTYAEAIGGAIAADWKEKRRSEYETHLRGYLLIPATRDLAKTYAEVYADCRIKGTNLGGENDLWIAATGILYDIPLLTNDHSFRQVKKLIVLPP